MTRKVKHHSLGKLEIYIAPAQKVESGKRSLFRKLFPKSNYMYLIQEARKDGIINAAGHGTHTSFTTDGKVITCSVEGDHSKLIVMGTHGRSAIARMLTGSVAEYVIRHAAVPVLITPPRME